MSLERLARVATEELLERTAPHADQMLDDLKRTRRRRAMERSVVVIMAGVLVVGGWLLATGRDQGAPEPVDPIGPDDLSNGALVSLVAGRQVLEVQGSLRNLPRDTRQFTDLAFTSDGSELVYHDNSGDLAAVDLEDGDTRILGSCPPDFCDAALSPDGTQLAFHDEGGLRLRTLGDESAVLVPTPGTPSPALPKWSPDGRSIAFSGRDGLYVVSVDGTGLRRVFRSPRGNTALIPSSWSPDGNTIAFISGRPPADSNQSSGEPVRATYTLMTVRVDGTELHRLHDAGRCFCIGISSPTVAWSPDGALIAFTVIDSGPAHDPGASSPGGVYLTRPGGGGLDQISASPFQGTLAWQPLPEE